MNIFMNLHKRCDIMKEPEYLPTHGWWWASAAHIPAAPADWMDLSESKGRQDMYRDNHYRDTQKPAKWASLAGSLDIAPMSQ